MHGTAIALAGHAALVRGPAGSGKSDLALRCLALAPSGLIQATPQLVADDQVRVTARGGRLVVSPPETIAGLIEVRGVGILRVPYLEQAELALVADIVPPDRIERLPEPITPFECLGIAVRRCLIAPFQPSASVKLLLELSRPAPA